MQIPSKCFTKRKQRHETIHQNYPPPMQKMHYKTLSILIGNIPDFVAPKPSFYWPFTCSILHPFFTLIGAMRRGYWAQEEKVVEARKKPKKKSRRCWLRASSKQYKDERGKTIKPTAEPYEEKEEAKKHPSGGLPDSSQNINISM